MVPFSVAELGDQSHVYRCPPGQDFGWVTDPEYFDDCDVPTVVKRQVWQLVAEDTVVFHPPTQLCPTCQGEEIVTIAIEGPDSFGNYETVERDCPNCEDGRHPFAGRMEILPRQVSDDA